MKIAAAVFLVLVAAGGLVAAREAGIGPFSSTLPVTLAPPHTLSQSVGRKANPLAPDVWTNHWNVHLSVAKPTNAAERLQVELAKNGAPAANTPRATASLGANRNSVIVRHLAGGSYQWWARLYNGHAISQWVPFSSGPAFRVDTTRPSTPVITSSSDPSQGKVYKSGDVSFDWNSTDKGSGIHTYQYSFGLPGKASRSLTGATTYGAKGLATGDYVLTVRAEDLAGNWSPTATYRVTLDSTAPSISNYGFSTFAFNPHYTGMTFNYLVTEPATVRIGIYSQASDKRVRLVVRHSTSANQLLHYTWKGRDDHSRIVPPGEYSFVVRTTDAYGNTHVSTYSNLKVLDKVIIVSLTQQKLWAYQDGHSVLSSLVTTGNVNCCATPPGVYTILAAYHPFTFISPAKEGTFFWYPPSPVNYAMLFQTRGFYIHDAPWRTVFGPGTNLVPGPPGSPETGSHGCVNTPYSVAKFLYYWAPVGTPVKVLK